MKRILIFIVSLLLGAAVSTYLHHGWKVPGDRRMHPRWMQQVKAIEGGYFWCPCVICLERFGGHEWGPGTLHFTGPDSIGHRIAVCPSCEDTADFLNGRYAAASPANRAYFDSVTAYRSGWYEHTNHHRHEGLPEWLPLPSVGRPRLAVSIGVGR